MRVLGTMKFATQKDKITEFFILTNLKLASFIKSVPFELDGSDSSSKSLRIFPQIWKKLLWYLVTVLVYGYGIYESSALLLELVRHGLTARLFMLILYFAIHLMNALFYSILLTSRPQDFVFVYNCMERMITRELGRTDGVKIWTSMPIATFCVVYFFSALLVVFAPAALCIYLINPTRPVYLYSLLPAHVQSRWDAFLLGAAFEAVFYYWSFTVLVVHFCYWCGLVFQTIQWLMTMQKQLDSHSNRIFLKIWTKNRQRYENLQRLVHIHNASHRHFLCGYNGATSTVILLFLFCSLRAYGVVRWYVYMIYPLFAFFGLFLFIICHPLMFIWKRKSHKLLLYARKLSYGVELQKSQRKLVQAELRALRPIVCEFSYFGHISAGTYNILVRDIFAHLLLLLYY